MLLDPARLGAGLAGRHRDVRADRRARRRTRAPRRTARRSSCAPTRTRPSPTASPSSRTLRGELARELEPLGLRAAAAGHAPVRRSGRTPQISDGDRYQLPLRLDARARAARADVRAARARRRARPRERACARSTGCARTCRCCSRCRPTRRSGRAATPAWPRRARRCSRPSRASASRAPSLDYADYVEHDRPAAALRGVPRADLPVVGRAPAAALRHDRGADHGRADDASTDSAALDRARAVRSCASRSTEGSRVDPRSSTLPEVLAENRFLAARDGAEASLIDARLGRRSPVPHVLDALLERCAPHAEDLGCVAGAAVDAQPRGHAAAQAPAGPRARPGQAAGLVEALSALF